MSWIIPSACVAWSGLPGILIQLVNSVSKSCASTRVNALFFVISSLGGLVVVSISPPNGLLVSLLTDSLYIVVVKERELKRPLVGLMQFARWTNGLSLSSL